VVRWSVPLPVRALLGAALLLLAVQVVHAFGVAHGPRVDAIVDHWAFGAVPVLAAIALVARAVLVRDERLPGGLAAGGVAAWAAGNVA
jgi:hypothetical protein